MTKETRSRIVPETRGKVNISFGIGFRELNLRHAFK